MKGRKANQRLRDRKTDPAKRLKRPSAVAAAKTKRARKLTPQEQTDQRAELAQKRAEHFAALQKSVVMPDFFADVQYAGAAAIWSHFEPLLQERNFWSSAFIVPFTGFCIYADEFLAADREVKAKGWGVEGKSTSGGNRFWRNPAVDVRDHAFNRVLDLSSRFGFTSIDLYKLEREAAAAGATPGRRLPAPPAGELAA
jgi:phage terminase small subunit